MNLADRLQADMTRAMRERDEPRRDALRMAIAAVNSVAKQQRRPLTDDEAVAVLQREIKARRESLDAFSAAGRTESAAHEQTALDIVSGYLPQQLSAAELSAMAAAAVDESGAATPKEMGKVMALLMPRIKGRAEGKQVSAAVAQVLTDKNSTSV